jgi:hypothetical protein
MKVSSSPLLELEKHWQNAGVGLLYPVRVYSILFLELLVSQSLVYLYAIVRVLMYILGLSIIKSISLASQSVDKTRICHDLNELSSTKNGFICPPMQ